MLPSLQPCGLPITSLESVPLPLKGEMLALARVTLVWVTLGAKLLIPAVTM